MTATTRRRRSDTAYVWMLFPALALFTVFVTLPALVGVFFSFTNYAGFGSWKWVGFENYRSLWHDSTILGSYRFTLLFAVVTTIVVNALALALAIGLSSKIHFKRGLRSVFFVPMVLSGIVVAYVFQYFFSFSVPSVASSLGWTGGEQSLLANQDWAWLGVVIVTAWQAIPSAMIIYLAGLLAIPGEVYEAASLDGASAWRRFRSITLPLVAGYVVVNSILSFKNFLNAYDVIVGLTGGGPGTSTTSVAMGIFNGFNNGDYAYSMANAVVFFVITVVISLLQLRLLRGREVNL
ncbi:carbohydrate ABC transporter permease [Flexivirga meconopsidis]|uniref:carbohydrate ABC transporter permease n=1 Tax=Flexivirga meconopsidis TaxID=2977121 RepID=UPI00223F98B4|nr:sugar ABC transporter permease [Flexivirga meconopsidis]